MSSLADEAGREGTEAERCIVKQYVTTPQQRQVFVKHINSHPRNKIPVEWVIDIADESNGWFYGTAYHFDDTTRMLHVMVPDKMNPTFDGEVLIDYRTVHLIECVDGKTDALFNKIVRDSFTKVKWEVDWFEEDSTGAQSTEADTSKGVGKWSSSMARYYIRIANQLLLEDADSKGGARGFVMLTADLNVKLKKCLKGKGKEDYVRLIEDGIVQCAPDALVEDDGKSTKSSKNDANSIISNAVINKIEDMTKALKECVSDLLDEREAMTSERLKMAGIFKSFALDGDLDAGMSMLQSMNKLSEKAKDKSNNKGVEDDDDYMEVVADDTWHLVNKIEKGIQKLKT